MGGFGRRGRLLIGVGIAPDAVCLLQWVRVGGRWQVAHYACEPMPPAAVMDGNIVDTPAVGAAIARAVVASGVRGRDAAVAVPAALLQTVTLPAGLPEPDLEALAELEVQESLPPATDAPAFDFAVSETSPAAPERLDVTLAAARSSTVRACVDALQRAGLVARVVDVEPLARERAQAWLVKHPLDGWGLAGVSAQDAPALLVACGLALHGTGQVNLNLLPWRARRQRRNRQWSVLALMAAVLLGVAVWWWLDARVDARLQAGQQHIAVLEQQLAGQQAALAAVEEHDRQRRAGITALTCLHRQQTATLHLLAALAETIPDVVVLDAVQQHGLAVSVDGRAGSANGIALWMPRLHARDGRTPTLTVLESLAGSGYRFQLSLQPQPAPDAATDGALACSPDAEGKP